MSRVSYAATIVLLLLAGDASTEEKTSIDEGSCDVNESCALHDEAGPWSALLQEWAVGASEHQGRHGRIMALPPAQGYYVTDRMGSPMLSPPPPSHHQGPPHHPGKHPNHSGHPPLPPGGRPYDEWQHTPPSPPTNGKIVNRPPNPYKDKFKPSYPGPSPNQPIPVHGPNIHGVDRVDENRQPPQKQVSETDLYLLSAIEKLVYRADLMEKRLRKMEETMHYLVAGVDTKPAEPCATNFSRWGAGCYHVSAELADWKRASYACRRLQGHMLEIDSALERRQLTSAVLAEQRLKGADFWTGGLNPGLLWIWSHSAKPVVSNSTTAASNSTQSQSATIVGEGRCLAWVHDPAVNSYVYRGQDCGLRHRYICEKEEDKAKLGNEIERVARKMREGRKPKIIWSDDQS